MTQFWAHNAPRLGLCYPFLLHLIFATAAYHLALLNPCRCRHYKRLADIHVAAGTADLTDVLANLSDSNCGAAYIGATLLCYCAFAAGPSGPDDLFLCHVGGANKWQNLVSGVRLVRESFQEDVLIAGLMSPMGPSKSPEKEGEDLRPICAVLGFTRANWRDPISKLAQSVRQRDGPYARVCLHSLDELASIYEGVYGDELGNCNVSADRRFVLGWLYRLDSEFVVALQCSSTQWRGSGG
jgi:hypothetical protein